MPNALLWLMLPFYVYKLKHMAVASHRKMSLLSVSKMFLAIFLIVFAFIDLFVWILDKDFIGMDIFDAVVRIVTFLAIVAITQ